MSEQTKPVKKKKRKPRGTGRPGGRPPNIYKLKLTDEDYTKIQSMAGIGLNMEQMAALLGVCRKTLFKMASLDGKLKETIMRGRANAIMNVSNTAYKTAISGKYPEMTRFYLKCRAGWKESMDLNVNGKTEVTFITQIGQDGVLRKVDSEKDELNLDEFNL